MKIGTHPFVYYKKGSRFARKLIEHKLFRSVLNTFLILLFSSMVVLPTSKHVFGQTQTPLEDPSKVSPLATEEVILTTKKTSRSPVVGRLSQGFNHHHPGVDIENTLDEPIHPFLAGVIYEAGFQGGGYGNYVLIDHRNGYFSLYAHLAKVLVERDTEVMQDTVLGTVGLTGYSTGAHLHFEIYENGIAINPLSILPELTIASASGSFVGGPPSIPSRTLILPIGQKTPIHATGSAGSATQARDALEEGEEREVVRRPLGVWLPDELALPTPKPALDLGGSAVSRQLPKLLPF